MDCGPASLKCLLEGFGIRVSYGRLREACQTDVDGTSIDTLEEVAVQLGLEAEQMMVPVDHVLLREANCLPALAVVVQPSGTTHFVVIWGNAGPRVQVMDPGAGRRWPRKRALLDELYRHQMAVPAEDWLEWACSEEFCDPLLERMRQLGCAERQGRALLDRATSVTVWTGIGALDASVRMAEALARARGVRRGREATGLLVSAFEQVMDKPDHAGEVIPSAYWSVLPNEDQGSVDLRGAVLVRIGGRRGDPRKPSDPEASSDESEAPPALSPDLVAALEEPPSQPLRDLYRLLRQDGLLIPSVLAMGAFLSAAGVVGEALLLRGLLDIGRELGVTMQRLLAMGTLLAFLGLFMCLKLPIVSVVQRMGRRLEVRLRAAFMTKIPRLGDRYFHSRLTSDMAERSHSLHMLHQLPGHGVAFLDACFSLVLTTLAIAWMDPSGAWPAMAVAVLSVILPLAVQPILVERNLRVRAHNGALMRFYLDALLGLVPIRAHGAEMAVRREHESLLTQWVRASLTLIRASLVVEGILALAGVGMAIFLIFGYLRGRTEVEGVLLLLYWALRLPTLGQEVAVSARQYPGMRNVTLRLMEPLAAPEEGDAGTMDAVAETPGPQAPGVALVMRDVGVRIAGHTILRDIDLTVEAGTHLAVVGPSGAGKSSLVGLLLGWHSPSEGELLVDGQPLNGASLARLRRSTAWVDPAVQIWNRSFLYNLRYGSNDHSADPIGQVIERADLHRVLETLTDGLRTPLGEGGGLVSGGEGQRVRLGRALLRREARLVILDEPFRGLDREKRRLLLGRVRAWWPEATLICITHDVSETLTFPRVLVIEGGRLIEDGSPEALARQAGSRYQALLDEEERVREGLWQGERWRHLHLDEGKLDEAEGRP